MSTSTAYVNDKHIPDGYYTIKNYGLGSLVALLPRRKELCGSIRASTENSFVWHITRRSHGKYLIRSCPDNLVVQCTPAPEGNDTIFVLHGEFDWVIRQVSDHQPDCYIILPGRESRLVWSLADGDDGTSVVFAQFTSNPRFWWKFARMMETDKFYKMNALEMGLSQPYDEPSSGMPFSSHLQSNINNIPTPPKFQSELEYEPPLFPEGLFDWPYLVQEVWGVS
ncbi:hypothetical protein BD410DRAFT_645517 [Rickenella mellea]|uniref:Ricin B lectin domain-containing protein n=1 Tax=Rickenella mellea TaxID=50990 RepID=A0A4Y7PLN4_9AGAM|nr:hypothetical protein BD410DRAFT_645517 [Rickenella mellea]